MNKAILEGLSPSTNNFDQSKKVYFYVISDAPEPN